MPWNAEPHRFTSAASSRPNPSSPLPGSVHKLSPRSLAMQKPRRASPNTSFTSLSESNSPPNGSRFEYFDPAGDDQFDVDEALVSPDSSVEQPGFPDTDVEPCLHVEPAQRRSLFLAEGMLKEHVSCDRVGRDRDGYEVYVVRMVESHGFRWNRYLHRLAGHGVAMPQQISYSDSDSDCYSTDDDANDVFEQERDQF